jgi:hypothetical protein
MPSLIKRFNRWYKKYQYLINLFSILILGISLYSIKISVDGNEFNKRIHFESKIPVWIPSLNYESNNLTLESVKFSTTDENIKLEKISLIYLDLDYKFINQEFLGNKISGQNLNRDLIEIVNGYLVFQAEEFLDFPVVYNIDECYPIVIVYTYLIHGELNEAKALYKLHFSIFKEDKLKIKNLEFTKNLETISTKELKSLNCDECIGLLYCEDEESLLAFVSSNKIYDSVYELVYMNLRVDEYINFEEGDSSSFGVSTTYKLPEIIFKQESRNSFLKYLKLASSDRGKLDKVSVEWLNQINDFIKVNELCEIGDKKCIVQSNWGKKEILYKWLLLNENYLTDLTEISKK